MSPLRHAAPALLLLVLGLVAVVYAALPRVYFGIDDLRHLSVIADRGALHFIIEPFAGHMLLVRNAVFVAARAAFGFNAAPYGWLSLVTHLVNVALLFCLTWRLTHDSALAALAAALWGMSPLHAGTLISHAVYGQVLVGTILLVVLERMAARSEQGQTAVAARTAVLWAFLLWVGSMCFGVGIAVAMVFPAVVFLVLERSWKQPKAAVAFAALPIIVVATYVAMLYAYTVVEGAGQRELGVFYSRVLPAAEMLARLCAFGVSTTLRSFAVRGEQAATSWPLVVAWGAMVVLAFAAADGRTRRWVLALGLLAISSYGLIAVARADLYALFGLSIPAAAKSFRYHYVATIPVAILSAITIGQLARVLGRPRLSVLVLAGWIAMAGYLHAANDWHLDEQRARREAVASVLRDIDARIDAQPDGAAVYIPVRPLPPAVLGGLYDYAGMPGTAALFVAAYPSNRVRNHDVYFVEDDDRRGQFADPKHHRLSTLLVSRETAATAMRR